MSGEPSERRRHDEVLADIARFAGSSLELEEVLERIVERAAALTGADRTSILLLDRSGRRLVPSALWGMDPAFTADWKTRPIRLEDEPLSREALLTGEPVTVTDASADPRTDKRSVAFFGDQSILVAPLSRRDRRLGTLFLNHVRRRYAFTREDVETTAVIAAQAAIAIDNARLYGATRRLAEQLRRSFRYAGEALAAGVDVQSILQSTVQLAVETAGADGGSLRLLDESGRGTYLVVSTGERPSDGTAPAGHPGPLAQGGALRSPGARAPGLVRRPRPDRHRARPALRPAPGGAAPGEAGRADPSGLRLDGLPRAAYSPGPGEGLRRHPPPGRATPPGHQAP
jgi:GAF domain